MPVKIEGSLILNQLLLQCFVGRFGFIAPLDLVDLEKSDVFFQ